MYRNNVSTSYNYNGSIFAKNNRYLTLEAWMFVGILSQVAIIPISRRRKLYIYISISSHIFIQFYIYIIANHVLLILDYD